MGENIDMDKIKNLVEIEDEGSLKRDEDEVLKKK